MQKRSQKMSQGFTLIELLLYIALVTIMLSALIPFAWNIIGVGAKSTNYQEVSSQARYISERMKQEIRASSGINSVSATSISLSSAVPATNPTIIDLVGGKVRITQGAGPAVFLQSNDTITSSLVFTNYSSGDNKTKHIRFVLTVDDAFASSRQEYQVPAVTIDSSAEVRSN